MLIEKQFSNVDREEERVFSVLMSEEELRLYSEFLEEREFDVVGDALLNSISKTKSNAEKVARRTGQSVRDVLKRNQKAGATKNALKRNWNDADDYLDGNRNACCSDQYSHRERIECNTKIPIPVLTQVQRERQLSHARAM